MNRRDKELNDCRLVGTSQPATETDYMRLKLTLRLQVSIATTLYLVTIIE